MTTKTIIDRAIVKKSRVRDVLLVGSVEAWAKNYEYKS